MINGVTSGNSLFKNVFWNLVQFFGGNEGIIDFFLKTTTHLHTPQ